MIRRFDNALILVLVACTPTAPAPLVGPTDAEILAEHERRQAWNAEHGAPGFVPPPGTETTARTVRPTDEPTDETRWCATALARTGRSIDGAIEVKNVQRCFATLQECKDFVGIAAAHGDAVAPEPCVGNLPPPGNPSHK